MKEVLSARAKEMHIEQLRDYKLRLSIFEKSYPGVSALPNALLGRLGLPRSERERLVHLRNIISAHELFFSSFSDNKYNRSELASRQYGDISHLLNSIYRLCMDNYGGFVYIFARGRRIELEHRSEGDAPSYSPILAIDNCEHVYFLDYGFDKKAFLTRLLPYLSLSKIDEICKIG